MILSRLPKNIKDIHDLEFLGEWDHETPPAGWSLCYNTTNYVLHDVQIAYNPQGDCMWERAIYSSGELVDKFGLNKLSEMNVRDRGDLVRHGFMDYDWDDYDTEDWAYMPITLDPRCVFE